jgi:L-asparaginase
VDALLPTFNGANGVALYDIICEQLAQIDSKDMSFDVWERLYVRIQDAQDDEGIDAIVVTHGTDTLEETAYFLAATLVVKKPVVLTGAMRPANALDADGPQNLSDALRFAATGHAGVYVVFSGKIILAARAQKMHPEKLDAFEAFGDESIQVQHIPLKAFRAAIKDWPRVEIVMSYAGASGDTVEALIAQKINGIVVAGTGNGTIHHALEAVLHKAKDAGIAVILTTRCVTGGVIVNANHAFEVSQLSPVKARIALMLRLLVQS